MYVCVSQRGTQCTSWVLLKQVFKQCIHSIHTACIRDVINENKFIKQYIEYDFLLYNQIFALNAWVKTYEYVTYLGQVEEFGWETELPHIVLIQFEKFTSFYKNIKIRPLTRFQSYCHMNNFYTYDITKMI